MAGGILAPGTRSRGLILGTASIAGLLILMQFVLPGGQAGKGTPPAVLFGGVITGLLNALIAAGIILIYRSTRIINFAQAAMGAAGGIFTYNLTVLNDWPFLLSFVAGVLVAALIGVGVELGIIRRFFNAPRLVLTVLTIALVTFLVGAGGYITNLPIFPNAQDRTLDETLGRSEIALPFKDFQFQIGDVPLQYGFPHLFALFMALVAMAGLAAFLKYSKLGVAVRATAENPDRARLLGINVGTVSLTVWTIAAALSGLGVILQGITSPSFSAGNATPEVVFIALAAAVLGRMTSLPVGIVTAIALSTLKEALVWSYPERATSLTAVGLFVIVLGALLLQRSGIQRSEEGETTAWRATEEQRPVPKEMLQVGGVRVTRIVLGVLGLLIVLGFPWVATTGQINIGGYLAIITIVALSLVVLTGWAGQVSLGQMAIVAIGAVLGGAIGARWSFWLALPIVPILTAGIAVLIGIPALRIKGLFLAISTYALAFAVEFGLFREEWFGWLIPERVDRPTFLLLDFEDERSMYYLCIAALVGTVWLLSMVRRTRGGRVLIALRENENNVQSFGINLVRTRLTAFALAGFICGFAGVLLAHHQRAVAASSFPAQLSLDIFLFTVVGGVGSIAGALLGGTYFAIQQLVGTRSVFAFMLGPVGILVLLYFVPGGLASMVFGMRDAALRIIAQRKQIVVPSLFADVDPLALERRLIPLAEPIPNSGLGALPYDQRYKGRSELYERRGRLILGRRERTSEEAIALGAVAAGLREAQPEALPLRPGEAP